MQGSTDVWLSPDVVGLAPSSCMETFGITPHPMLPRSLVLFTVVTSYVLLTGPLDPEHNPEPPIIFVPLHRSRTDRSAITAAIFTPFDPWI